MKNTFTEANGYEASFAYSLKNDEQITAAQKFIQDALTICFCPQQIPQVGIPY